MAESQSPSTAKVMAEYSPFDSIDPKLLGLLAKDVDIRTAEEGFALFQTGDYDTDEYYLIDGTIKLLARDGRVSLISSGQPNARHPIARLRPRMYKAIAASKIHYFVISASVLDELQRSLRDISDDLVVQEMQQKAGEEGHALLFEFEQELKAGRFELPSLPEVAFRIRDLLANQDCNMSDVAKMVNTDPAIAAKLVKVANSALYRGVSPCDDTLAAISRLGLITTKQLITSFAVLSLFESKSHIFKDHMRSLWKQSVNVAAYSYVLAKQLPAFNPEEALLAGLIHAIGEIVVLTYAERFYDLSTDEHRLSLTTSALRGPVGGMVLEHWSFNQDLVTVARESGNWLRENEGSFDYCDLVQVAVLYATQGANGLPILPQESSVPAFVRLAKRQFTTEQTNTIVKEAEEQISELRNIIR
jgi:HD-like signal output (HDOD) protein